MQGTCAVVAIVEGVVALVEMVVALVNRVVEIARPYAICSGLSLLISF
jgi:hypothetical protein